MGRRQPLGGRDKTLVICSLLSASLWRDCWGGGQNVPTLGSSLALFRFWTISLTDAVVPFLRNSESHCQSGSYISQSGGSSGS